MPIVVEKKKESGEDGEAHSSFSVKRSGGSDFLFSGSDVWPFSKKAYKGVTPITC